MLYLKFRYFGNFEKWLVNLVLKEGLPPPPSESSIAYLDHPFRQVPRRHQLVLTLPYSLWILGLPYRQ